ncbi:MAG TPA: GTP-binding protein [Hanamia sp.]|nr:GTP-binding protein [Hanamia sp.]
MRNLKLFLVGGFLGSGKTTAIYQAAIQLLADNMKVAVITNDQGTLQVDSLFFKAHNIDTKEVSGSCFCCNYHELDKRIKSLESDMKPEVIFAESVGSCSDLAATIINPLLNFNPGQYEIVLSVFADVRLLVRFLQNDRTIFLDHIYYIYEKQLEEADIIVVNKTDLYTDKQMALAKDLIQASYPGSIILYQNSLSGKDIEKWLITCRQLQKFSLRQVLEIDYDEYGAGEAELAWLDEEIGIVTKDNTAVSIGYTLIKKIYNNIKNRSCPIGHLKFLMDDGKEQRKIGFNAIAGSTDEVNSAHSEATRIIVIINARIQTTPALLREIVADAILETELSTHCKIIESSLSTFVPGYPKPTYRITA